MTQPPTAREESHDRAASAPPPAPKPVDFRTVQAELKKAGLGTSPPVEMADGVAFNVVGHDGQLYPVKLTLDDLATADAFDAKLTQLRRTYGGQEAS